MLRKAAVSPIQPVMNSKCKLAVPPQGRLQLVDEAVELADVAANCEAHRKTLGLMSPRSSRQD